MDRYLRAVPMANLMDDTYAQIAKQIPEDKRAQFLADMHSLIKIERLEQLARSARINTFTVEELNALADFYSSPNGASAMAKYGTYMGEIMAPPYAGGVGQKNASPTTGLRVEPP